MQKGSQLRQAMPTTERLRLAGCCRTALVFLGALPYLTSRMDMTVRAIFEETVTNTT